MFTVLSGDDSMTLPMMAVGAKGVISVISNIAPGRMADLVRLALEGDYAAARAVHIELFPLMRALMKVETNPSPIKAAMNLLGMEAGPVRLPLSEPDASGKALLEKLLRSVTLS
jgi:4-hydroxy-tetrahydrodipicolinate synthase